MTFTLWRGSRLLGELRSVPTDDDPDPAEPPSFMAVLVPAPDAPAFDHVWQVQFSSSEIGVQQEFIEPDAEAERDPRSARHQQNSRRVAGRRVAPGESKGVPPELQFTIRDAAGKSYLPHQLVLEKGLVPEEFANALVGGTTASLFDGGVWTVAVFFEPGSEALRSRNNE